MKRLISTACLMLVCLPSLSTADDVKLTIYDDGRSCPANCDAHVVFHSSLNGTHHAHLPDTENANCISGQNCEICFDDNRRDCMEVMYRGTGPGEHTFDLTPAFYQDWCGRENIPSPLARQCALLQQAAARLDGRINCIQNPEHAMCSELMTAAVNAKANDEPKYQQCVAQGQSQFNQGKPLSEQRAHGCAYEKDGTGGPNSNGLTWKRLLPGACRADTFVGRDGLDCCSGMPFADGPLGIECRIYYPLPSE